MKRRNFIGQTAKAALAFTILPRHVMGGSGFLAPSDKFSFTQKWKQPIPVGVQLYAIRNYVNKDLEGTAAKLAEMGYQYVEPAGYNKQNHTIHDKSPKVFAEILAANGLKPISSHAAFSLAEADAALDDFATVGVKYLVCPSARREFRKTIQGYEQVAEELNTIGKKAKERGISFGYHNHDFEFKKIDDQIPYDVLLKNTVPDAVFFQVDIGWMVKSGNNPIDYFKRNPGRFPLWHVRDIDNAGASVAVGTGKIDFNEIFANKKLAGLKCGIVETQLHQTEGMQIVEKSIQFLQQNKLF